MAPGMVLFVATLVAPTRPSVQSLREAPAEVQIGKDRYVLEAEVWRDFSRGVPKGVGQLYVRVLIMVKNGGRAPAALDPQRLWLLTESGIVWDTPLHSEVLGKSRRAVAANGPALAVDSNVDVVVQFKAGTRDYLIQAKQRFVGKEN